MKTSTIIKLLALLIIMATGITTSSFSQKPEQLFQQGLIKEEGEGSLQEAIDIYNKVVDDVSAARSLRANALLHVGLCYEKLGQEKAKKTYEKLIADFADQGEVVAIGKKKLANLNAGRETTKSEDLIIRQVWAPAGDVYGVSPDGRYLNYINWDAIELAVRDIKTGETWNITDKGTWKAPVQFPDNSVWSSDSKQLAYYWFTGDGTELRIANIDGTGDRLLRSGQGYITPWPVAWSPDGQYILALADLEENDPRSEHAIGHIVLVSVDDGSIRVIKTLEPHQPACCGDFSPDSKYIIYPLHQEKGSHNNNIYLFATDGSSEQLILEDKADDNNPLWIPDGKGIVFRSDRMGTDDLWTLKIDEGVAEDKPELLKSNLGEKAKLLGITRDNTLFYSTQYMRSDIFMASMDFSTGQILSEPHKISSMENERNVKPIWSPDGRNILYLSVSDERDNILGHKQNLTIYDTESQKTRTLDTELYLPGSYFLYQPQWSPDGKSLLIHARTNEDSLQGFFSVDIHSGDRTSILVKEREQRSFQSPIGNSPVFSKDGKNIFYLSEDTKSILTKNPDTKQERTIYTGEDQILQFKLSPDGTQIVFGNFCCDPHELFIMSSGGGEKRILVETEDHVTPYIIDWTPDARYLIFQTGLYRSEVPREIYRVPANGGDPERIFVFEDKFSQGEIENIEVHPDGKQIVLDAKIGQGSEVWTMENLFKK